MAEVPKISKYVIYCDLESGVWWARVPFGSYTPYPSWRDAAAYLRLRHQLQKNSGR